MKLARKLQNLIAECVKCAFIDKPFIRYQVYTHWLPSEVKILAIGESPPPGQKDSLFYNLKSFDRFRLSMKLILNVKDDLNVLKLLKSKNVFVTAAVKCRPLNKSKIEDMRRNCKYLLKTEIKLLKPKKIVAMGRTAALTISEVLSIDKPSSCLLYTSDAADEG